MMDHISRSWGKDAFAPQCGCHLLECGMVEASEGDRLGCDQHAADACKTIRSSHDAAQCPSVIWADQPDGVTQKGWLTIVKGEAVKVQVFVRVKPGVTAIYDPQAITLRGDLDATE